MEAVTIDGSFGEGGGQILRTAIAFSLVTRKNVHVTRIREKRPVPGVKPQHLHAIKAACMLWNAKVEGAEIGSTEVLIRPGPLKARKADIQIGTAGSITLLLQALLLPAIASGKEITLSITGGTDVKWSIPIDFFSHVIVPYLKPVAHIDVKVLRRGYFPKGNGLVEIRIRAAKEPRAIDASTPGELLTVKGIAHASADLELQKVSERMAAGAVSRLKRAGISSTLKTEYQKTDSTGAGISLWAYYRRTEDMTNGFVIGADRLGERGKPAERLGEEAAEELISLKENVIDSHSADNLLPFIAHFGGSLKVPSMTGHITSGIYVIETILGTTFNKENYILTLPGTPS